MAVLLRSFAFGLSVGAIAGAAGAMLVFAYIAAPTVGSESMATLLGAVTGGGIGFASALGIEYVNWRRSERIYGSIVLRFCLTLQ